MGRTRGAKKSSKLLPDRSALLRGWRHPALRAAKLPQRGLGLMVSEEVEAGTELLRVPEVGGEWFFQKASLRRCS